MSIKENKELIRRVVDLWNKRDVEGFFKLCAPEYIEHLPTGEKTLEELKNYAPKFYNTFPDIQIIIKDMVAEDDKVVTRWVMHGTHEASMIDIPATGKRVMVKGVTIKRIASGKVVEEWALIDMLGLMQQIGARPLQ